MKPRSFARPLRPRALAMVVTGVLVLACGTRTALLSDSDITGIFPGDDSGATPRDATTDRSIPPRDASRDSVPGLDVTVTPDAPLPNDCPDAESTFIYVVTSQNELYSFYPPTLSFKFIGNLACPASPGETPFSMAVDRKGFAYVLFTDGNLFRVSTKTAACLPTSYQPNQLGWSTFGMGFSSDDDGNDQLFVTHDNSNLSGFSDGLGTINTQTFRLSSVATFSPPIVQRAELTGTGDGRLFAYWPDEASGQDGAFIAQINRKDGQVIGASRIDVGSPHSAFAFAFWGGDFWIFSGDQTQSSITKYDTGTNTASEVSTIGSTIVGAGVSTCAPQQ
ncbi:MAG: hypothetical protein U0174_07875 [Polyangiaceae bacterium]